MTQPARLTRKALAQALDGLPRRLDRELTRPMAALALVMLVLIALALPRLEENIQPPPWEAWVHFALLIFWPIFLIEFIARQMLINRHERSWPRLGYGLLVCLAPPLRIGLQPATLGGRIWLPGIGWRKVGRPLVRRLEARFSGPMIAIGLMILPVFAVEFLLWRDPDAIPAAGGVILDAAIRIIWLAFALELAVMLAATDRKLSYCLRHWLDLVIVLVPFVAFLRSLRLVRAARGIRLTKVAYVARTFRLRAVALRLLRAALLLRVAERLHVNLARRRLTSLRRTIELKAEELEELRESARELEAEIEARAAQSHPASAPEGQASPASQAEPAGPQPRGGASRAGADPLPHPPEVARIPPRQEAPP